MARVIFDETDPAPVSPSTGRLRHSSATSLTITRRRSGKGFSYRDGEGHRIADPATLARIRKLAIPPAYVGVRIAADPRAHLQAVGHDEAGRVQHRYHPDWEKVRERRKLKRLKCLIDALPKLRAAVARDLKDRNLTHDKALACAAAIIDHCHIRVGNEAYARANGSHGASTLLKRHVAVTGARVELAFKGKSGKQIACAHEDRTLARALTRVMALPGRRLLQYRREDGSVAEVRAGEINAYLKRVTGLPVSSKDLRMLAANAAAAELLLAGEVVATETGRKRQLADIMRAISERLVNTPAVVRKSYVHEIVLRAHATGRLRRAYDKARARGACSRIERALGLLAR
ncbi:MAG TPA: DNA topoisomerase IB [Bosea sp. (in: a-proteobacteria)]|jgi:DNA topoisomerase-1|uniref:DNA topoisomerase IB n=1 Tax=Bosea sp. (in: a-proteobacteria) TaxID=1871050 RepID=UPI002E0EDFF5|nr:DNA topoisomerase IB [Bosea sp. (in: a-proteobacteria)]